MAAIVDKDNSLDIIQLSRNILENLPAYARPIFIRVLSEIPATSTFKLKKYELQGEGYDITRIKDKIYILDQNVYQLLSNDRFQEILDEKIRI